MPVALLWRLSALYLLSGAAALVLEVGWSRALALYLGHTTGATSTVIAAFMGGLALGAVAGGHLAARLTPTGALRVFACAELTVALTALAVPAALRAADPLLTRGYADGAGGPAFGLLRVVVCLGLLLLPTTAMGAGYPLLARALAGMSVRRGEVTGWLYAANTTGASAGALLAGFFLLPGLGLHLTTAIAAAADLLVAALALAMAGRPAPTMAAASTRTGTGGRRPPRATALVLAALLGAASMGVQVVYTRVLALIVGPTTYAFSALLAVWIGGVAVGALLGTRAARSRQAAAWLAVALAATTWCVVGAIALVDPLVLAAGAATVRAATMDLTTIRPVVAALVLVGPVSICLGAAFPLLLSMARTDEDSVGLGHVYASNTLGGIAGALLAGFLVVPLAGLQPAARGFGGLALATTLIAVVWLQLPRRAGALVGVAAMAAAAGLAVAGWTPGLLASGAYRYAPTGAGADLEVALQAGHLLYLREGAAATVAVRRLAGTTSLIIDGKPDASDAGDMLTQKLLAHLPLLLHERPRQVAVVGLGSGVTLGAALRHPVERVEVVEIAPEVVAASAYFSAEHGQALADPRTRILVTDARTHLRFARTQYDVVISEPSNPWMAGVAALFTREFMDAVRARLRAGGLFCQWAHTYDMSEADLRSILATFRTVFPDGSVWLVGEADLLLVGGVDGPPDLSRLAAAWQRPGVAADLRRVDVATARDLEGLRIADAAGLARLAAGATPQEDDRLALEFTAPRSLAARAGHDNLTWLRAGAPELALQPAGWASRGRMLARAEAWALAFAALSEAVQGGVADETTLAAFARAAAAVGRMEVAVDVLRGWIERTGPPSEDDSRRRAALARLLAARGDLQSALAAVRPVPVPDAIRLRAAAAIIADVGDGDTLARVVGDLRIVAPDHPDTAYFGAAAAFLRGALGEAEALADGAARRFPRDARLQHLLGAVWATQGRRGEARAAFARAMRLDPREAGTYVNAGRLAEDDGRPGEAAALYAEVLVIAPEQEAARAGLSRLRSAR